MSERAMIPSRNYFCFGLALWLLAAFPLHAKDIIIATSSMTLTSVPYLIAIEKKFFEKEGLTAFEPTPFASANAVRPNGGVMPPAAPS